MHDKGSLGDGHVSDAERPQVALFAGGRPEVPRFEVAPYVAYLTACVRPNDRAKSLADPTGTPLSYRPHEQPNSAVRTRPGAVQASSPNATAKRTLSTARTRSGHHPALRLLERGALLIEGFMWRSGVIPKAARILLANASAHSVEMIFRLTSTDALDRRSFNFHAADL